MGKYPDPKEARQRFETGVEFGAEKWKKNTLDGADDYEVWYTGFATNVYPVVASLPDKKTLPTIRDRVMQRVLPVAEKIHELSVAYRKAKLRQLAETAKSLVPAVKPAIKVT